MSWLKKKLSQLEYFKNILDKAEINKLIILFILMFASMLLEILILNYVLKILNYFTGNKLSINVFDNEVFNYFLPFANKEKILLFIKNQPLANNNTIYEVNLDYSLTASH